MSLLNNLKNTLNILESINNSDIFNYNIKYIIKSNRIMCLEISKHLADSTFKLNNSINNIITIGRIPTKEDKLNSNLTIEVYISSNNLSKTKLGIDNYLSTLENVSFSN